MATIADSMHDEVNEEQYRSISSGAIIGVVLGALSVLIFIAANNDLGACIMMSAVPLLGLIISYTSLRRIREMPNVLTGQGIAKTGVVLSAFFLISGIGYGTYVYATEVPDGYKRLSFSQMKASKEDVVEGKIIPPKVAELQGKKVFIKGYIRPGDFKKNLTSFLFVRDNQECCFGDVNNVKFYDQITSVMPDRKTVDYSTKLFRVTGTIVIQPESLYRGNKSGVYTMVVDSIK